MTYFGFIIMSSFLVCLVNGYSTGPPDEACATMTPGHYPNSPQTTATPYTVTVSKNTYNPAEQLTVTINTSESDQSYKGIFVQARHNESGQAVGSWTAPTGYKLIGCNAAASSALGHSSKDGKSFPQNFNWTAPASSSEAVTFYVTVVRKYDTFWVKTPSASVASNRTSTKGSSTAKPSASTTSSSSKVVFSIHSVVYNSQENTTTSTAAPNGQTTTTVQAGSATNRPDLAETTTTSTAASSTTETSTSTTSSSSKLVFSIHICVIMMSLIGLIA